MRAVAVPGVNVDTVAIATRVLNHNLQHLSHARREGPRHGVDALVSQRALHGREVAILAAVGAGTVQRDEVGLLREGLVPRELVLHPFHPALKALVSGDRHDTRDLVGGRHARHVGVGWVRCEIVVHPVERCVRDRERRSARRVENRWRRGNAVIQDCEGGGDSRPVARLDLHVVGALLGHVLGGQEHADALAGADLKMGDLKRLSVTAGFKLAEIRISCRSIRTRRPQ